MSELKPGEYIGVHGLCRVEGIKVIFDARTLATTDIGVYDHDFPAALGALQALYESQNPWVYLPSAAARIRRDGTSPQTSVCANEWTDILGDLDWVLAYRAGLEQGRES